MSVIVPIAILAAAAGGAVQSQASLSKQLFLGSFKVEERRAATDTPSTLATQEAADRYISATASFGKAALWRDGITCLNWEISPKLQAPPTDRSIEDLLRSRYQLGWADLICDERAVDRLFVIDGDQFLSRTSNGATWLVWRRAGPAASDAVETKASSKF